VLVDADARRRLGGLEPRRECDSRELAEDLPEEVLVEVVAVPAVGQQRDREPTVGKQTEERGLPDRAAVVADDEVAVPVQPHPAEPPRVRAAGMVRERGLRLLHLGGGGLAEDPGADLRASAGQVHPGEGEHVPDARGDQARGAGRSAQGPHLRRLRLATALRDVADRAAKQQRLLRQRDGVIQPEGLEQTLPQCGVPDLPGQLFDDPPGDHEPRVAVGPRGPERMGLRCLAQSGDEPLQAVVAAARVGEQVTVDAAGVGEQVPHGHLLGGPAIRERELGQHVADRGIQVEPALLDQLHHQRGGEHLGDRADLEQRVGGRLDAGRLAEDAVRRLDPVVVAVGADP
jgi:hypothetical protein